MIDVIKEKHNTSFTLTIAYNNIILIIIIQILVISPKGIQKYVLW